MVVKKAPTLHIGGCFVGCCYGNRVLVVINVVIGVVQHPLILHHIFCTFHSETPFLRQSSISPQNTLHHSSLSHISPLTHSSIPPTTHFKPTNLSHHSSTYLSPPEHLHEDTSSLDCLDDHTQHQHLEAADEKECLGVVDEGRGKLRQQVTGQEEGTGCREGVQETCVQWCICACCCCCCSGCRMVDVVVVGWWMLLL